MDKQMEYINAKNVLPKEVLSAIQTYYQGGYLYIPRQNPPKPSKPTDYQLELQTRNQWIYLKHLEGRTNRQLAKIYHLSEPSIRRIIAKEKVKYQKMKEIIRQILPFWGISSRQLRQIYPSAWEINNAYVIKVYDDKNELERNCKLAQILLDCGVPAAETILTETGSSYAAHQGAYFLLSKKLRGSNLSARKDQQTAYKMGAAIAKLHKAFVRCEKELEFWDNSLLKEMQGWVREILEGHAWQAVDRQAYEKAAGELAVVYDDLPKQLIHRDVHYGNFLFYEGELSGYIDFDLSQRNIRIFDLCYFLAGLLSEETDDCFTKKEWLENVGAVVAGYESIVPLSKKEKRAVPCVMECIEMLCAAYFIRIHDTKHAEDACHALLFLKNCESDLFSVI